MGLGRNRKWLCCVVVSLVNLVVVNAQFAGIVADCMVVMVVVGCKVESEVVGFLGVVEGVELLSVVGLLVLTFLVRREVVE